MPFANGALIAVICDLWHLPLIEQLLHSPSALLQAACCYSRPSGGLIWVATSLYVDVAAADSLVLASMIWALTTKSPQTPAFGWVSSCCCCCCAAAGPAPRLGAAAVVEYPEGSLCAAEGACALNNEVGGPVRCCRF